MGRVNGITIVSDYAHHPTEVQATIQAARTNGERVFCIFQPHRYTRTAYFMEDFARAFQGADLVLLHRIYPAGEKPIAGVTSEKLAGLLRQAQKSPVYARESLGELEELALELARPGDSILVMGAGDINNLAHNLYKRLEERE
ncbi:MAG: UDP-N-acetylmuramate--L-alanine ligase [Planctomycetes bacterium ADurb.Bin412]|nr:MAG: UDP-N-acetylmuramate--L-alanine ligase [Planctomycetes bacterium ADurb.Bin412]